MRLVTDALLAVRQNLPSVIAFTACMVLGAVVILTALERAAGRALDMAEHLSLAAGGWIVPAVVFSALGFAATIFLPAPTGDQLVLVVMVFGIGIAVPSAWAARRTGGGASGAAALTLGAILAALVCMRLAVIAGLSLPLYFDSVQHYRIIQALAGHSGTASSPAAFGSVVSGYYHVGFHLVLAAVARISHARLGGLMLVSGQIVLATLPLSLYIIPRRETGSVLAGLLAVAIGGLGWYMPTHALSWGKYPAVFSIGPMLFALNTAYVAANAEFPKPRIRRLLSLAAISAIMAVLIHTRAIVVLALILLAWAGATKWLARPASERRLLVVVTILTLLGEVVLISSDAVLSPGLDPYLGSGIWATVLIGLLSVPAFHKFPRLAFGALLAVAFLLAGLLFPGPIPALGTLLDRPLVEILLFIPLSMLGAVGFAALTASFGPLPGLVKWGAAAVLSIVIAIHGFKSGNFQPSACCSLVTKDDTVALDWIARNLPEDARILVASEELTVFAPPHAPQNVETGAGGWILPLTERAVSDLAFWSDFREPATLFAICQRGATDVYAGVGPQSFREKWLRERPAWYHPILSLPEASVYHVSGCAD